METFVSRSSPIYASLLLFDQETHVEGGEKIANHKETLSDQHPSSPSHITSSSDDDQDHLADGKPFLQDQIDNLCIKLL